jgi:hypothetical protein
MPRTTTEWFFLRDGRKSFKPHPLRDREMFFCHQDVQQSILASVEQAYALGTPIKLILWGDWGVGKTHTLRHLDYWLEQHAGDYPTRTIYVEIGDLDAKSSFAAIHSDLLEEIGLQTVIRWVHEYVRLKGSVLAGLESIGVPMHIREVVNRFLMTAPGTAPTEVVTAAWQYLRGEGNRAPNVGIASTMTEGKDFYQVLASLGHLCEAVEGKKLLFMVDEAAKLDDAGLNATMERHWVNVNKLIFDQDNTYFGFIYTVSGKTAKALPKAIYESQIQNRLGANRLLQLRTLEPGDVRLFLSSLFERLIDQPAVLQSSDVTTASGFGISTFPFTAPAFDEFVAFFQRAQQDSKPRDIADRLDSAAFDAFRKNRRLIDEDSLQAIGL